MKFNAHRKGAREWMGDMMRHECVARLRATSHGTQYFEEGDLVIGELSGEHDRLLDSVLADRCVMGDPKTLRGVDSRLVAQRAGCPFGCRHADGKTVEYTWSHACLTCDGEPLVERRAVYRDKLAATLTHIFGQLKMKHGQFEYVGVMHEQSKGLYGGMDPPAA